MEQTINDISIDIDQLLQQSIAIYQEVDTIYQNLLQISLNTASADKLAEDSAMVEGFLLNAGTIDSQIQELQQQDNYNKADSTTALLAQRKMTIASLLGTNKIISKKAQNVASVLKHDCGAMAKNHTALAGYGNTATAKRNIFKSAF